jgi:F0F1-type ATP synthase membrane subunit b/b'
VKQYQEALKKARVQVYTEQEAARKKVLDERAARLKDARTKASAQVTVAKEQTAKELAEALREMHSSVTQLAMEIARRLLQPRPSGPASGAR